MSVTVPTLVIENATTGKVLFEKETTFPQSRISLVSALKKVDEREDKLLCYLQIESRANLNDNLFNKRYKNHASSEK